MNEFPTGSDHPKKIVLPQSHKDSKIKFSNALLRAFEP